MADITNPDAIRFSDELLRPAANMFAQAYYKGETLNDQWVANGSGQAAYDLLKDEIIAHAKRLRDIFRWAQDTRHRWFSAGGVTLIPNTADPIVDNQPAGTHPAATGEKANDIVTVAGRVVDWQTTDSFGGGAESPAVRDTIHVVTVLADPSLAQGAAIITRHGELATDWEANTNQNLNRLLAYANNPGS